MGFGRSPRQRCGAASGIGCPPVPGRLLQEGGRRGAAAEDLFATNFHPRRGDAHSSRCGQVRDGVVPPAAGRSPETIGPILLPRVSPGPGPAAFTANPSQVRLQEGRCPRPEDPRGLFRGLAPPCVAGLCTQAGIWGPDCPRPGRGHAGHHGEVLRKGDAGRPGRRARRSALARGTKATLLVARPTSRRGGGIRAAR